jgi:hypothetical protein
MDDFDGETSISNKHAVESRKVNEDEEGEALLKRLEQRAE